MFNVRLNYALLQLITAVFSILSYLTVRDALDETGAAGRLLTLLPIITGVWALYTIRIFYLLVREKRA